MTLLRMALLAAVVATMGGCYGDIPQVAEVAADPGVTDEPTADDPGAADPTDGGDTTEPTDDGDDDYFQDGGYILDASHANVLRSFTFLSATEDGRADGFNLDGRVSEDGDEESCGHGDLLGLDGEEGIDNQLARIWAQIGPLVGLQVHELLQGAINEGRVLLMLELVGADNLQNADDVTLNLFQGELLPDIGTQGLITPGQTFYYDYEGPASSVPSVSIVDGEVTAGPVYFELPIDILDAFFILRVRDGQLRFRIDDDGTAHGVLGGAFSISEVLADLYETNAADEAYLVTPIFEDNADLGPPVDGVCDLISVGLAFEGANAWVVRYPELD